MIAHSNDFKDAFTKLGRDLLVKINFYEKSYNLETEDDKLLLTQDSKRLLTEPIKQDEPIGEIDENDIISLKKNNLGELYHTYMKSFDLETTYNFTLGDKAIIQIGTTVNGIPEYLSYGTYIIYSKQYSEATKTYTYTLCDSMLLLMVDYDNDGVFGNNTQLTLENFVEAINTKLFGLVSQTSFDTTAMTNKNNLVYKDTFKDLKLTYRDVLDMVMQSAGCSLIATDRIVLGNILTTFKCITINNSAVDELDEDIIRDDTAIFKEKFGPINSLILSRADGTDEIEKKDDTSITNNGKTSYVIKDNLILQQENRSDFLNNLFDRFNGIEYYTNNINTVGVGYIEYLDRFDVRTTDNIYHCICLQNTGDINNGMNEEFKSPAPSQKEEKYVTTKGYDDKIASILMDKINGTIVLKTDSQDRLAEVRLDSSGDEGSVLKLKAKNIDLEGYTTINEHFHIDNNGDMQCVNATMTNANITDGEFKMTDSINETVILDITKRLDTDMDLYYAILNMNKFDGTQTEIQPGYAIFTGGTYGIVYIDAFNDPMLYCSGNLECGGIITSSNGVCQGSLEEKKKDFEELKSGLDIIKDIDIYKYRYKDENGTKKHIGLVIGDKYNYSKEVTNDKNDSVDIYSFVSVCCKAIQEQQEQIEQLKKEIKELKK